MTEHPKDPCLEPFLRMVDGGVQIGELFKEEILEKLRRDSVLARLDQPRSLYFQVPRCRKEMK